MKCLVFDSSSMITLSMNNLLWTLEPLKKKFNGDFCMPELVKREVIDVPIRGKRFKLEAFQVKEVFDKGIIKLAEAFSDKEISNIKRLTNNIYRAKGRGIRILHEGEISALLLAKVKNADALVVDERSTRMLVEEPDTLKRIFEKKLHVKVTVNKSNLNEFQNMFKDIKIIRSIELGVIAYEMGLFDRYLKKGVKDGKDLLDAVLWGMKIRGCSVSEKEIKAIVNE